MSYTTVGNPVTGFLPSIVVENRDGNRIQWIKSMNRLLKENLAEGLARTDARALDRVVREFLHERGYRLREGR